MENNIRTEVEGMTLPSRYQVNQMVKVKFCQGFEKDWARVIKVHFTAGKISYDLEFTVPYEDPNIGGEYSFRLYNVDSVFVVAPM